MGGSCSRRAGGGVGGAYDRSDVPAGGYLDTSASGNYKKLISPLVFDSLADRCRSGWILPKSGFDLQENFALMKFTL